MMRKVHGRAVATVGIAAAVLGGCVAFSASRSENWTGRERSAKRRRELQRDRKSTRLNSSH